MTPKTRVQRTRLSENADAIDGKALKAFAGQQHDAHIMSHMLQGMSPIIMGNPLAASNLTKHILDHVRLKAEEQVEAQIFETYGPENKGIVSDIQKEGMVAMLVAQGMKELRQMSQELSGAGAPDPLIELKEKELDLRAQADQAKAQDAAAKRDLDAQGLQQRAAETEAKLETQEAIADQKAEIAMMRLGQMEQANAIKARQQQRNR
jgi:hypothetical protein